MLGRRAAGWRAEWGLPPPISTMHPLAGSDSQEEEHTEITRRRSLFDSVTDSEPEDGFGEVTLDTRWLEEQADADPADFAELQNNVDSSADSRAQMLERRLTQQMQQMQEQMQERTREQQQATDEKVASLQESVDAMKEQINQQAEESNERLDQLITLVSAMQGQQQQQAGRD